MDAATNKASNAGNADGTGTHADLRTIKKTLPLRVFTPEQFEHWQTYGFAIIPQVIPKSQVDALKSFLWEFQEMDASDPASWYPDKQVEYGMKDLNGSGMVEAYHHQTLWDNRQSQTIYDAFVDVWDREDLWVTIDRANLNPPNKDKSKFDGFLHWDIDTTREPLLHNVQAIVTLVDTTPEMGGFQCVPDLFRDFDTWKLSQPKDRDGFHPELGDYELVQPQLKAGDLFIWNSLLAHGIRVNNSNDVRMAQYIAMFPAQEDNASMRDERLALFREKAAPVGQAFAGDPRGWEKHKYPEAQLNTLGQKLLGSRRWAD